MADPYEVLEISRGASDEEIRRRYLELVRRFPPEREPERFAVVRRAYEELRDPVTRLRSRLIELDADESFETILDEVKRRLRTARIPVETLLALAERR